MKKRLSAIMMALGLCAASLTVYAEDTAGAASGEVTAESLLEANAEALKDINSTQAQMTLTLDGGVTVSGEDGAGATSIGLVMNGEFDIASILDPLQIAMEGTYDMSLMGQTMTFGMEMYTITSEDGTMVDSYVKMTDPSGQTADEGWQHTQMDMQEMLASFNELGISDLSDLQNKTIEELFPGMTFEWNITDNSDSYNLATVFAFSSLVPMIEDAFTASGEELPAETKTLIEEIFNGLVLNYDYDINKETNLMTGVHIDFNDSELATLNELISAIINQQTEAQTGTPATASYELVLNDFSMDAAYNYDEVAEITVPADALTTEVYDAQAVSDMLTEMGENATEAAE